VNQVVSILLLVCCCRAGGWGTACS